MDKTPLNYINNLHTLFETSFMDVYRATTTRKRHSILPFIQAMYRRWFYSTIVEETPMSPANLLESICRSHNLPPATYPVAYARKKTNFTGVNMELKEYSLSDHPITADLKLLINYCTPHIDLPDDRLLDEDQVRDLTPKLGLNDPHYVLYLVEIALEMQLITKAPSVGVNRYKPAPKEVKKLESSPKEKLLHEIVEAAISLCAKNLGQLMPDDNLFTISFIRSMLTSPMETDDIFDQIYDILGYDLEDLMEIMSHGLEDDPEDVDLDLLMGTFTTGIFLDKYFFTPFGHFMKLIRPLYVLPFDLVSELTDYLSICHDTNESVMAFYAPCSSYTLTDLGLEFFKVKKSDENYIDVSKTIPFENIKDSIFASKDSLSLFVAVAQLMAPLRRSQDQMPTEIYTFRVRFEKNKTSWIHLQMPIDASLHDMYIEIAEFMDLKDNQDYSFFHDKTENRFAQYSSPKRKRSSKIATETPLDSLDWEHQQYMLMVAYNQSIPFGQEDPTVRLELEMMHRKPAEPGHEYPRVSRYSKKLLDIMEEM
ncbi:MAG: hypothetical protein FWC73_00305 [Defluviitaleaceae bacterium]|nr:hypothetical protein [Defluviitaleaceae bacterium]